MGTFESGGITFKTKEEKKKVTFYELVMPETIITGSDIKLVTHVFDEDEINFDIDSIPSFFTNKNKALKARMKVIKALESRWFYSTFNILPMFLYLALVVQSFFLFYYMDVSNKLETELKTKINYQNKTIENSKRGENHGNGKK